ncbi:glycoside hydrolase family 130 protein [Sphingobacterium sp. HJSM2_6]|uniref:glycoside hydrolase family 130 protein n=1 Tax=Sphingobacterium sp. HJSM2_6 TaxID=3366264 RepID=UPI003BD7E4B3
MAIKITRKDIFFRPDQDRVLARRFTMSDERTKKIIQRVLGLNEEEKTKLLTQILRNYAKRHRSIVYVLQKNYHFRDYLLEEMGIDKSKLTEREEMLIGAYLTMEYSIEAAAYFNPSIIISPDQTQLNDGECRVILSFRAVGEGHLSSIVFRSAVLDNDLNIVLEEAGILLDKPKQVKNHRYNKEEFIDKLLQLHSDGHEIVEQLKNKLPEYFIYDELRRFVREIEHREELSYDKQILLQQILWLASSHYEISYSMDTAISERVIFPISDTEKNGIEDARFVQFKLESGKKIYYATYTAYDGHTILPKLLSTKDFLGFKVQPINGKLANKGAALFPRKINGKYAMLCRVDGENSYIAFSDRLNNWQEDVILIDEPQYPWEFVQVGNCGSPLETSKGWLVITHSVGPLREYSLGALLLDLQDPTKVIGKLKQPLLYPNHMERNGYVPNVVYSCGQVIHNGHLIIPYGFSDQESTYATILLDDLLEELLKEE